MKLKNFFLIFFPIFFLVFIFSFFFGSASLSFSEVVGGIFGGKGYAGIIIKYIRLPRILAGALCGIGLSVSGVLLQTVTANELASPNVIGINSGAGLAVIVALSFFSGFLHALPFIAFFGAFLTSLLILFLSTRYGSGKSVILLVGIGVTTLFGALISLLSLLDEDVLSEYNYFTVGSLKGVKLEELLVPAILIVLSFMGALLISKDLSLLSLGDKMALSLGVNVKRLRFIALTLASLSASAVISYAGLLGFVGLVVPHIAKAQVGENPRKMLVASTLLGATVVLLADLLGRVIFAPSEMPVGILMSIIGAPYFLVILLRRKDNADL